MIVFFLRSGEPRCFRVIGSFREGEVLKATLWNFVIDFDVRILLWNCIRKVIIPLEKTLLVCVKKFFLPEERRRWWIFCGRNFLLFIGIKALIWLVKWNREDKKEKRRREREKWREGEKREKNMKWENKTKKKQSRGRRDDRKEEETKKGRRNERQEEEGTERRKKRKKEEETNGRKH